MYCFVPYVETIKPFPCVEDMDMCNICRCQVKLLCSLSGANERQTKLRELGAQKLLQQLLSTSDTVLFDK